MKIKEKTEQIKTKVKETGTKAVEKAKEVGTKLNDACGEYPEAVLSVLGTVATVVITVVAASAANSEAACRTKDGLTECEYRTKHPLNNREILELSDKMQSGMTKGEALNEMGLLKKERKRK